MTNNENVGGTITGGQSKVAVVPVALGRVYERGKAAQPVAFSIPSVGFRPLVQEIAENRQRPIFQGQDRQTGYETMVDLQ